MGFCGIQYGRIGVYIKVRGLRICVGEFGARVGLGVLGDALGG